MTRPTFGAADALNTSLAVSAKTRSAPSGLERVPAQPQPCKGVSGEAVVVGWPASDPFGAIPNLAPSRARRAATLAFLEGVPR